MLNGAQRNPFSFFLATRTGRLWRRLFGRTKRNNKYCISFHIDGIKHTVNVDTDKNKFVSDSLSLTVFEKQLSNDNWDNWKVLQVEQPFITHKIKGVPPKKETIIPLSEIVRTFSDTPHTTTLSPLDIALCTEVENSHEEYLSWRDLRSPTGQKLFPPFEMPNRNNKQFDLADFFILLKIICLIALGAISGIIITRFL